MLHLVILDSSDDTNHMLSRLIYFLNIYFRITFPSPVSAGPCRAPSSLFDFLERVFHIVILDFFMITEYAIHKLVPDALYFRVVNYAFFVHDLEKFANTLEGR